MHSTAPIELATPNANGAQGILIEELPTRRAYSVAAPQRMHLSAGRADAQRHASWAKRVELQRCEAIDRAREVRANRPPSARQLRSAARAARYQAAL